MLYFGKHSKTDTENWKWLEDPYALHTWGKPEIHGHSTPAPHPKFGTEPPIKRM